MAALVTSCGDEPKSPASPKLSTTPATPGTPASYPPETTDWDVAGSLTGSAKESAQFAAETEAKRLRFLAANDFSTDLLNSYNERVIAAHKVTKYDWAGWHVGIPSTGGELVRATSSTPAANGQEITLCEFNTPGEFSVVDGHLKTEPEMPNARVIGASTVTVEETTQPSGTNSSYTKTPRMLIVAFGYIDKRDAVNQCDKFAPEPFIQATPSPTSHPK
ncbi:hypothetical protein [Nocardia macrotermitis]|nr:hypothetical protein [Nocardia macrotermitis]